MYALLSWHALFSRHSVVTFFSTLGDQFFLNMQRRGNRLGTFGHHRRPSGKIGKGREASVNPWELSGSVGNLHFDRFFTRFRHQIVQIWSYRGIHTTNRCEISRSIDSEGGQRLVFDIWWWTIDFSFSVWLFFLRKQKFSSRNRSGRGFTSSRLVGMTAWVSGLRKSSFLPKFPRKAQKNDDFLILASGLVSAGARSVKNLESLI